KTRTGRPVRPFPALPQSGERERAAVPEADRNGLLLLSAAAFPFVEPIGQHQAAALVEGFAEGRFDRGRLRAGIHQALPGVTILRPRRDLPITLHLKRVIALSRLLALPSG